MKPRKRKKLKKLSHQPNHSKIDATATITFQSSISTIYPIVQPKPKPQLSYSYATIYPIRLQCPIFSDLNDLAHFKNSYWPIYYLMR